MADPGQGSSGTPSSSPEVEAYLRSLRRRLMWMSGKKKRLLVFEARAHLEDLMGDGLSPKEAVARFGQSGEVAKSYRLAYGYGPLFWSLGILGGFFLGFFTVPVFFPICLLTGLLFTLVAFVWIVLFGAKAGQWAGLAVGLSVAVTRTIMLLVVAGVSSSFEAGDLSAEVSGGALCGSFLVSLLMLAAGFLAGHTVRSIREREEPAEL